MSTERRAKIYCIHVREKIFSDMTSIEYLGLLFRREGGWRRRNSRDQAKPVMIIDIM
jgi:hypothetical protein